MKCPEQTRPQRQAVGWLLLGAGWGVTTHGDGVSLWRDENVLELDGGGGCTTLGMYQMPLNYTLYNVQVKVNVMLSVFYHNLNFTLSLFYHN